jgi:uncharacterized protein (DUF362 family)/ferredoxin
MNMNHPDASVSAGAAACPPVFLIPCATYEADTVREALSALLLSMGGLDFVTPGMTVGIKANLVSAMKPEEAATTHPALLCALVSLLKQRGAGRILIGDSPGGLYTSGYVNHIYDVTGLAATVAEGAELNQDFGTTEAVFPEAKVLKSFTYTAWLDACDALIDFCKLKSHGMMGMSAAAKNMFGVIPGTMKPEYHFRFPHMPDFAAMLVDINDYFSDRVKLCLVDAVEGMEGNGPTKGTPRHIGLLLASTSPHSVDAVCAHIIGLDVEEVPTLLSARERGRIPADTAHIPLCLSGASNPARAGGASGGGWPPELEAMVIRDFKNVAVRHSLLFSSRGKLTGALLKGLLSSRPQLKAAECVGCGKCAAVCPAKAITIQGKPSDSGGKATAASRGKAAPHGQAVINRDVCIRCFCCQEFCPTGAMKVHRTWIARLITR